MTDLLDPIAAAACGPTVVVPPLPDLQPFAPNALSAMRGNGALSISGPNEFLYEACGVRSRGWIDVCSPRYTGEIGTGDPPQRYNPNVEGGGIDTPVLDADFKQPTTNILAERFVPFTYYSLDHANCLDPLIDPQENARRQVMADAAWWVTAEIDHAPLSGNPSLRTVGWDLTPAGGPVSVGHALMILMRAYRVQGMGGFVVWAPWELTPIFENQSLITARSPIMRTVSGLPIVLGPGLTGVRPELDAEGEEKAEPPDPDAPLSGEVAIYATRSIAEYRLGDIDDYPLAPNQRAVRTNQSWAESYRSAAVRFDPACVYAVAVRADLP